jgi:hypothetical protein
MVWVRERSIPTERPPLVGAENVVIAFYFSYECTPKRPSSEPHDATRQQAIAEIPAKWSAYQIPSVTVVFVVLVFTV